MTAFSEDHNHVVNKAKYFQEAHKISDSEEIDFVAAAREVHVAAFPRLSHAQHLDVVAVMLGGAHESLEPVGSLRRDGDQR